jgi:four helix bundle protein
MGRVTDAETRGRGDGGNSMANIRNHRELKVWQEAMDAAMDIYKITKSFPEDEKYSLVDQIRRSSRSVAANIAEAWRKRRYEAAFRSKLNDSESEACETQTWIEIALRCNYLEKVLADRLDKRYENIMAKLVIMIRDANKWTIRESSKK